MASGQLEGVLLHLRKVTRRGRVAEIGDAELLERFITRRDEAAFEQLVQRHGPMVLGVCRRVLGNDADAEDAFQATFLVLVRKATAIRPRAQVAQWLHGVAHKTSLKARAMTSKRRIKEHKAGTIRSKNSTTAGAHNPLLDILDEELNALPEKYRVPVVLCELEGLSYREAAARLGCPLGTVSGRLTRARKLLARKLAHRCPSVTPAATAILLAGAAHISVPRSLQACTIRAGTLLAAGNVLTESVVSSRVVLLAQGVLKMLLLSKLKTVLCGLLLLMVLVAAGTRVASWGAARAAVLEPAPVPQTEDNTRVAFKKLPQTGPPNGSGEAAFLFRGLDPDRKTVALVVAGTTSPVLSLPLGEAVRVLAAGREMGIDDLQVGTRVALRMDRTNRAIQEIRSLEQPGRAMLLKSVRDLERLEPPSEMEVLRALQGRTIEELSLVVEPLARQVDPPRHFPLVGPAELHHYHWKCTAYYLEAGESNKAPTAHGKQSRVEVVYIDKDYLVPVVDHRATQKSTENAKQAEFEKARQRLLRWTIVFDTKDGHEYLQQLAALGAVLALPTKEAGRYRVICDFKKRPVGSTIEDISKVKAIYLMESKKGSLQQLATALELKETPEQVIVLLPKFIEDELLRQELDFQHRQEQDIAETTFRFARSSRGYVFKVTSQRSRSN
jgi:RNA polymerase sigma factor (sigma-70 family)